MNYPSEDNYANPTVEPYIRALEAYDQLGRYRVNIEGEFRRAYEDLVRSFQAKCEECDRERRDATLWEKEHRLTEKELSTLRSIAVGLLRR